MWPTYHQQHLLGALQRTSGVRAEEMPVWLPMEQQPNQEDGEDGERSGEQPLGEVRLVAIDFHLVFIVNVDIVDASLGRWWVQFARGLICWEWMIIVRIDVGHCKGERRLRKRSFQLSRACVRHRQKLINNNPIEGEGTLAYINDTFALPFARQEQLRDKVLSMVVVVVERDSQV